MREILFRGKTENGRWAYGSLIIAGNYCCILESEDNVHPMDYPYLDNDLGTIDGKATPVIPETVGRLIDCPDYDRYNDERYFEGDIVEMYDRHYRNVHGLRPTCPRGIAIIVDEHSVSETGLGRKFTQDTIWVKVIGNVHDTPELVGNKYADLYKHYHGFKLEVKTC